MSDLTQRVANLSPEKRALLTLQLAKKRAKIAPRQAVPRRRDPGSFPLSFAQERLWFLDQYEPDSPFYNIAAALRLTGPLDVMALAQSFDHIARRHEVLRATFVTAKGYPVQVIAPSLDATPPMVDLRDLPQAGREAEALRLATKEAQRPFDLSRGPLLRAFLVRLDASEHVVLLTMHHIVSDGWSMGVLIREMALLYDAFSAGKPLPLPDLPIQYADFACWQREWLQGEALERQLDYWRQQLGGELPVLELPPDRPRPAVQTHRGAHHSFALSKELSQSLETLSRQEGVTLFMLLLAAFQTLLYRYTGQKDISVGAPIANRNRAEIEGLIGFFANTLVVRTDLSGEPGFRALLRRVREVALGAYAHQDAPFEMLVDAVQPERSLSHTPLFQVVLALQDALTESVELSDLRPDLLEIENGTAKFDLTLFVEERADGLVGALEYNTDLFDTTTVERLAGHFQTLLAGIVAHPDRCIAALPLLTEADRQRLLVEWNNTAVPYAHDQSLHRLFETQVERAPEVVAVVFEGQQLTYRELNRRANQLAHHLQKLDVGPKVLVGIRMERSPEIVVAILGILKAGGAYVPLDPGYPEERIAFMLQDTQLPVLLTQEGFPQELTTHDTHIVCLDPGWRDLAQESDQNLVSEATAQNCAYVLYTSGSTGRPKGICCHHTGVVNLLEDFDRRQPICVRDNCSWWTSPNFDVSVYEIFAPLLCGGTLHIVPELVRPDAIKFAEWLGAHRIQSAYIPPFMLADFSAWLHKQGGMSFMHRLLVGVEPIPERLLTKISAKIPSLHIINGYGPTETTICSTLYSVPPQSTQDRKTPIGRPVQNLQIYLFDERLQLVPIGAPGQVYVGGVGVSQGYLNRPDLTAERFIPHPFSAQPGARLYETGDLAHYLSDGNIEFLGRMDFQVKIRGFRIEPGEIQKMLGQHPNVHDVVVLVREDTPGDKRLVAYVVPEADTLDVGDLRSFLREKLPEYMAPSAFMFLNAFPVSPNGKVDRRALPAPERTRADLPQVYVAPRTAVERLLVERWQEILGLDRVGIHDNFFELGGDSLQAAVLINRLQEELDVMAHVKALFMAPTVAEMSRYMAEYYADAVAKMDQTESFTSQAATRRPDTPSQRKSPTSLRPIPRDGDLPLSFAQQRLWFLDQFGPGSSFYNIPSAVRLTGRLDVTALEQSLDEIVRRHQILRTAFATVDGRAVQVIAPALALPLPVVDLLDVPQGERETVVRRLAAEEAHRPFDLAQRPLARACLLRLDEACPEQGRREEHVFLLTAHHIVFDGWSTRVLIREVGALYEAFSVGKPSPLPKLPVQYVDYAYWQRQWLPGEVLESQLAYWKQQLEGSPPILELPTDRPRPAVQTLRGMTLWFELPKSLSDAIRTLSRQTKASLFMALLAAFKALLYRYTGQEDILVGTPIANRNRAEIEGLIGFFANTLVLRTDLSGDPGFRELLGRVREVASGAYAHQDVPFEMLVDELQPKRDMSYTPLFQVMFTIQDASMAALKLSGLTLSSLKTDSGTAKFDLTLSIVDKTEGLKGSLEYNAALFDGGTIERLAGHFQTLLAGIVAHPDRPISVLPLLTGAERQQMLAGWSDTTADYPRHTSLPHLFEAQVAQTPDAVAVVFQEEQLTYADLNRRANQLARYLQRLGVGPETLVGLCVERSPETVLGVVGILKAGGAYLPLDPTYPQERLAFMLQDARVPVLLTQERLVADLLIEETGVSLEHGRRMVLLDADWQLIARESDDNPASDVEPENLAYVIYTSGSTGRPKGSMIQHRSALHLATALQRAIYASLPDARLRLSLNAPLPFDASVQQLVMLLYGHALCIVPQEARLDGAALLTYLRHNRLNVLDCVPSQLKLLLAAGLLDGSGRSPSAVLPGGEAIDEATWRALAKAVEAEFYNMYGPTECAVDSTIGRVKAAGERPTIGRPVANAQLYVLDRRLQPAPIGVPGELHIGGAGVGRGYLNRPDLTAEKFVPHPFGDEPGAQLYKTGDLARYLPDGNVEFLGRIDHQVKVRGFRIELGEIEAVLKQHPALREVVALAREDTPGDKRLVAYLVAAQEPLPTVSELRSFLKEKLPEYMLPAAFVTLETLPLLPNGKVNRRALPAPAQSRPEMEVAYIAPRTQKEEILANVWRQVLGVEQVGVHDDFFELGGDSILSIQVIARANQVGLRLTPRQLFESPTVAGLAAVAGTAPLVQAEQGVVEGPVPLTPIQRWFFEQDLPEPHHWNQAVLLEVEQPLTAALLKAAVEHLVAHHDALRLRFEQGESGWQQVNAGIGGKVPFRWVNLSRLSEKERRLAVETHAAALQGSLDLTAGPLLRVVYFDLGAERPGRLLMVVHHLAIDGVSWRILLQNFQMAYRQLSEGMAVQLPPKTTSFRRWAQRLQEYTRSEEVQAELPRWLAIAQNGVTRLPVDYSGGVNIEASAGSVKVSLAPEETQALLQEVPAAYGTEINDALLTALVQAMARWTGSRALLVDLEGHGREDILDGIDLSRTVGWFTVIYPVSLDLEDADSPGEALKAVKEQLRRIPQRGIGYGLLRYLSQDEEVSAKLQILPQAEVSFNYLGQFDPALSEAGPFKLARESHGPERSLWSQRSHLLSINGSITGGRLQLEWTYSENLHQRATIERLAQNYVESLRALIAHCRSLEAGGYTPSDFPEAQLSQEDLDALMLEIGEAIGDN